MSAARVVWDFVAELVALWGTFQEVGHLNLSTVFISADVLQYVQQSRASAAIAAAASVFRFLCVCSRHSSNVFGTKGANFGRNLGKFCGRCSSRR